MLKNISLLTDSSLFHVIQNKTQKYDYDSWDETLTDCIP